MHSTNIIQCMTMVFANYVIRRHVSSTMSHITYVLNVNIIIIIRVKENSTCIIQHESIMCVANTNVFLNVHNIYTLRQAPPVTHSMGDEDNTLNVVHVSMCEVIMAARFDLQVSSPRT